MPGKKTGITDGQRAVGVFVQAFTEKALQRNQQPSEGKHHRYEKHGQTLRHCVRAVSYTHLDVYKRQDLDPVEEALGYRQLMERCSYTQEAAAARLSKSRSAVANSLRLLNLPEKALGYLRAGKLSAGHAKAVLSLESREAQQQAADIIVKEGLNVRQAEALCKKMAKKPRPKRELTLPPLPCEVELSLKEALGTEVHVQYKEGKGSLNVSFYSDEQLRAFANLLGKYEKERNL